MFGLLVSLAAAPPLILCYRYSDSEYEYRHVQLPKAMLKVIPKEYHDSSKGTLKLLWEDEWRALGITQVRNLLSYPSRVGCSPLCRALDGNTMRSMNQSHTFSCSSKPAARSFLDRAH